MSDQGRILLLIAGAFLIAIGLLEGIEPNRKLARLLWFSPWVEVRSRGSSYPFGRKLLNT